MAELHKVQVKKVILTVLATYPCCSTAMATVLWDHLQWLSNPCVCTTIHANKYMVSNNEDKTYVCVLTTVPVSPKDWTTAVCVELVNSVAKMTDHCRTSKCGLKKYLQRPQVSHGGPLCRQRSSETCIAVQVAMIYKTKYTQIHGQAQWS